MNNKTYHIVLFELADEIYGIDISKVYEVIEMQPITIVPRTQSFVGGVINLRGKVIPVFDIREKLNLHCKNISEDTKIIIIEIAKNIAGIIADKVFEIVIVSKQIIDSPSPLILNSINSEYLEGVISLEEKLIILLNIENILYANIKLNKNPAVLN